MIRCRKHLFVLVIISAIFAVFPLSCRAVAALSFEGGESSRSAPPAPTLISPEKDIIISKVKPNITGLTASGTAVYIYIDGIFNGQTEILTHESDTANFSYVPFLNLSVGPHEVWAVAKNRNGTKSKMSGILKFNIEEYFPAPTVFKPLTNKMTVYNKPYITGVARNGSQVKVFIDKKLCAEFKVEDHESGTANFAYLTLVPLTEGGHIVYTIAIDERGKESRWSNIEYFTVLKPRQPKISEVAAIDILTDDNIAVNANDIKIIKHAETRSINNNVSSKEIVAGYEADVITKAPASTGGIGELTRLERLDREKMNDYSRTGLINESTENQGKLKLNLIIFLFFLLAVAGWIFWVNRELIKEKRLELVKEDKNDDFKEY